MSRVKSSTERTHAGHACFNVTERSKTEVVKQRQGAVARGTPLPADLRYKRTPPVVGYHYCHAVAGRQFTRPARVARYGPYPPPPSPYVLYGRRYGTYDDGSTGGRAGGAGGGGGVAMC
eukprot:364736-Chlamydomonas_euryale.AAC.4